MERKIGETFEYEGKKLQVMKSANSGCDGCFFEGRCSSSRKEVSGHCQFEYRTDNNEVIFAEVQEQPQELNLCEILKDCPKGTKFWSPIFGDCEFSHLNRYENGFKSITVLVPKHYLFLASDGFNDKAEFNCQGAICDKMNECLLFPSKDQRDWGKWKCPKPRFDPKTLKPFDKVLVRNDKDYAWYINIYSHKNNHDKNYPYNCIMSYFKYCIPYNDDTKHLVGTTEEAPKFYKYWED